MPTSLFSKIPPEVEQAYIRVGLLSIFSVYVLFLFQNRDYDESTISALKLFFIVTNLLTLTALALLICYPNIRQRSRWLLQVVDLLMATFALIILGNDGHFMFFSYLFICIGYGIRYSTLHLQIGLLLSLAFYSLYLITNHSIPERGIILGNYALLLIIPPYIHILIKKRNEALEAAQASSLAKTMFLANISHELRTPLVGVVTAAELMETEAWDKDNLSLLNTIRNSSEVLTSQINRILDYARLESGDPVNEFRNFSLPILLDDCISILAPQAKKKQITLSVQADKLPECIYSDDNSLRQIIINIVGNAIKFTDSGAVTVYVRVSSKKMTLVISDTGIGISANKIETIFEPFTQADGSITKKYGGTGLGTAITKQLVDSLEGTISLSSTLNIGTTVSIRLPCHSCHKETNALTASEKCQSLPIDTSARILVADDNLTNQHILRILLEKLGFTNIHIVDNGADALEAMQTHNYDLVILDRHMPEMGGGEALRKYRRTGADIPSILLTADQTQEAIDECKSSGFNRLVIKPFKKNQLSKAISQLLSGTSGDN